jgi:hypothetical protein
MDDEMDDRVKCREARSSEHIFYRGRDDFMERHMQTLMTRRAYAHTIRQYAQLHGLDEIYIYRRVSQGELGENNDFNRSLNRQQAFLAGIAGHTLPAIKVVTLQQESIGSR